MQAHNRIKVSGNKKGWIRGIILLVAWFFIFSLAKDLWHIKKGFTRIEESKINLVEEEAKNRMLKDKLSYVMTDEYREKIVREQLNMQKVGEVVAVLPKEDLPEKTAEIEIEKQIENWERWWLLIK